MIVDAVTIPTMTKAVPVTIKNLVHLLLVRLRVGHILLRMNKVLAPLDSQYLLGNNKPCQFVEFLNTSKSRSALSTVRFQTVCGRSVKFGPKLALSRK
jgi:hypothetical protein